MLGKAAPQGSKKHVGKGIMIESSKRLKPWREAVKEAARDALAGRAIETYGVPAQPGRLRAEGPVFVSVTFVFDKPKSAPKRRRVWPITRSTGDIDKLQRSTFDALTDAGVMRDDSQIVEVIARKLHTDDEASPLQIPGAVIAVRGLTEGSP